MASAVEQLIQGTTYENPASFTDFYNAYGEDHTDSKWMQANPYGLAAKIQNFFRGTRTSAEKEYNQYIAGLESKHNEGREDTQYQRTIDDILRSGYNPYLALGSVSPASAKEVSSKKQKEASNDEGKALSSALKILAFLLLKSM